MPVQQNSEPFNLESTQSPEPPPSAAPAEPALWARETSTPVPVRSEPTYGAFQFSEPTRIEEPPTARSTQTMFTTETLPAAAAAAQQDDFHKVQSGDNYWTISRDHYGSARYFAALAEYNRKRIMRPEHMKPGMIVLIPSVDLLNERYPKLTGYVPQEKLPPGVPVQGFFVDAQGQPMFRVGKNDTLTDIAQAHLGRSTRWVHIFDKNRHQLKDPNSLTTGMILVLPPDASQVVVSADASLGR
jgi:nucleoid-associated protein YgaU